MKSTQSRVCQKFSGIENNFPEEITFITTQELEDMYPDLEPKERENKLLREKKAVFLMQIGKELKSGQRHDGRARIMTIGSLTVIFLFIILFLIWLTNFQAWVSELTKIHFFRKLRLQAVRTDLNLISIRNFLIRNFPYTIGGGIGQSRLCMYMLGKAHIGEVQASVWPDDMRKTCEEKKE